jgi:Asp-tRNA(Asn)/Glu-tRNA(Gln) amidotransferase C subunit
VELCRRAGITLQPTFVPFTPWTTLSQIVDLFEQIERLELTEAVAPIQLAIRLLITQGSRLLELDEVRQMIGPFDAPALVYPWKNPNPAVDELCEELQVLVASGEKLKRTRTGTFEKMWHAVSLAVRSDLMAQTSKPLAARATVPYLNEPWYC